MLEELENGLGLYLCQFFSQKLGVDIRLKSHLGCGAVFSLKIERYRKIDILSAYINT